ncbi:MAG TPA: cyclic nucleotide-binding domain-containing protein [Candidatus Limnocylindrales bacterium]|nr:cyclic nucleotide-binding domain-containing protein [Candidatus Limnocylindrales bacterium]
MPPDGGIATVLRRLVGNSALRRVLPAFFLFNAAEFGTWVAILIYAYERTGPVSVGVVALVQLVPAALLAPAAASLGDRYPRERVLAFGYAVQAIAMLTTAMAMLADAPVLLVYAAATVAASSLVVTRPTQSALLPALAASPEDLTAANAASGLIEGAGILAGPLMAAAILTSGTPGTVFLAAAVLLVIAALATMRLRPAPPIAGIDDSQPRDDDEEDRGVLSGLRIIVADRDARLVVGLLTVRMLMIGAADVLFVLLALDLLGTGEPGAGILAGALGAGAILGGAATFTIVGRSRLAAVAAAGSLAWGIGLAVIGLTASAILAPLLVVLGGAGLAIVDIAGRTMLQRSIRDEVLARVFGLQEGLAMAGLAAGSVLVPLLVAAGDVVFAVLVVAATLPVIVAVRWRGLTDLDRRAVVPVRELALLRRNPIFRPLPAPQLEAVARRCVWVTTPSGVELIRQGEPGDRFYVLAVGRLRVLHDGVFLRELSTPGEGVGEIALLRGVPRTATVTTTADSTLLAIDRAPFLTAVTGHPDASAAADREVARRTP